MLDGNVGNHFMALLSARVADNNIEAAQASNCFGYPSLAKGLIAKIARNYPS
jgi:hypothetical protein